MGQGHRLPFVCWRLPCPGGASECWLFLNGNGPMAGVPAAPGPGALSTDEETKFQSCSCQVNNRGLKLSSADLGPTLPGTEVSPNSTWFCSSLPGAAVTAQCVQSAQAEKTTEHSVAQLWGDLPQAFLTIPLPSPLPPPFQIRGQALAGAPQGRTQA